MENNFDKQYRNKLAHHNSSLDVDKFWSELEPKLQPKKKKRRIIFWLFFPLIVGAGIWYYKNKPYVYNSNGYNSNSQISIAKSNPELKKSADLNNSVESIQGQSNTNEVSIRELASKVDNKIINTENLSDQKLENRKKTKKSKIDNTKESSNKTEEKNQDKPTQKNNHTQFNQAIVSQNKNTNFEISVIDTQIVDLYPSHITHNSISNLDTVSEKETKNTSSIIAVSNSPTLNNNENEKIEIVMEEIKVNQELNKLLINDTLNKRSMEEIIKTNKKIKLSYYLRPEISIGYYSKSLTTNEKLYKNYIDIRNMTESKLESWSSSLNLGVQFKKLNIETGVQYLQNNEKLEYYERQEFFNFGPTTITREFSNGANDTIISDGWYSSYTTRNIRHYNKIQQWNLPIQFGYDLISSNTFTIGLQAGMIASLSNQAKGKILGPEFKVDYIEKISLNKVKNNLGLGLISGAYFRFQWNRRANITGRIIYQDFRKNYLESPLDLRYQNFSLGLGLQYRL